MSTLDLSKMPMPSEMPREMIKLLRSVGCQAEFSECGRNLVKFSPIMYGDTAWQHYERWARGARNVIVTVGCYATKYIEDKFVVPPWEDRNQIVREAASIRTHLARMDFSSLTQRVLPDVPGPLLPCPPYEIVEDPRMALTVLMERLRHPPAVSLGYKELNNLHPRTFMCDIVHAWKNACVTIHLIKP
ncbi:Uncharacterized protein PBTT_04281 [Plasmodiophora brassicae]|uniref:Uncharacterized protein n=1 Tax=Plasmodiophora brassicae TaxID=37360 RepID=A0A0G4IH06_PLABS|nr:hypothetical protein PBRA_000142 [Plasmodiophora brassicae]